MKKISTVFKKNPDNLALIIDEVDPANEWVLKGEGIATRKFDGTACAMINQCIYKRYDVKEGREVPYNAIPCQEADPITGHWPHWVLCKDPKADKYFFEALENWTKEFGYPEDGTYELCGPKINKNKEKFDKHYLIKHGEERITIPDGYLTFTGLQLVLKQLDIEGIVFHAPDGRMAKIRKSDYGIKR